MSATTGPTTPPGRASVQSIIAGLAQLQRHDDERLNMARDELAALDERIGYLVDELADYESQR